jgi:Zn-dependent protease with chaperone function
MPIPITCGQCKTAFSVVDTLAGKSTMCAECGAFVDVPEPGKRVVVEVVEEEAPDELSPKELKQLIRDAVEDEIEPVQRTAGYGFGVACVAVAMLMLPLFYLFLILLVVVLLYWHATENTALFREVRIRTAILLYVFPLIAGIILLAFLIKPLVAWPSRARGGRQVRLDKQPVLAVFVEEVARAVHAPMPRRIEVDCQVNASAGLGSGLLGMFGHNLTLTIGLPLVVGLNAQQLAGIVAHELGHFSQGAGMRLSYLIRSINHWFSRIVYERDSWDEALADWCKDSSGLTLIFYPVAGCVMATRGILWVFMAIGHGLSCFLLRRMEFDADRYEARLAGTRTFETTFRRMAIMDAANEEAVELVQGCYHNDRYPDDFAALVVSYAKGFSPRHRRDILEKLEDVGTGLFDTHPSFMDRLASVERENASGVFHLDLPASDLFRNLPKLSSAASLDFYRALFGPGIRATLRPVKDYLKGEA